MKRFALGLLLLLAGCEPPVVAPNGGSDCQAACERVRQVCEVDPGCTDTERNLAAPTPAGLACEVWRCDQGFPHEKNACLARATSAVELRACKGVGR